MEQDDEEYYKVIAGIIESILDPATPIEKVKEIGELLSQDETNESAKEEKVPSRSLARMARFDRMRPYLKEETYQILIHQDWDD